MQNSLFDELLLDVYSDMELKQRFLENPTSVLKARGVEVPDGVELRILEDSPTVRHIVLPHFHHGSPASTEELASRKSKIVIPP
jgi:hypothetical protein